MPPPLTELAPAKVNLTLHLTGLRADGYHLLQSLVVFAAVGDVVTVCPADGLHLTVTGPMATGVPADGSNLVLRAATLLRQARGVSAGAAIGLEKHLPHGGGIGGGSSDAATAIRVLARLWGVKPLTGYEAVTLGADLPVCLAAPAPTIMSGIGEVLQPAPRLPDGWLVLVNPGIAVPTGAVFAAHDLDYGFDPQVSDIAGSFTDWLRNQHNDLTKVACTPQFAPDIAGILARLRRARGVSAADMSGSGSTCWGWFASQPDAERAAEGFTDRPDWWVTAARVLRPEDQLSRATT